MKLKKILTLVLALTLVFSLCSCGKVTAESLIADMVKAMATTNSFSGTMSMDMDMSMSMYGETIDIYTGLSADMSYADSTTYVNGEYTMELTDSEPTTIVMEGYSVIDGDTVTTYSLTDNVWYKTTSDTGTMDMSSYDMDTIAQLIDPENSGSIVLSEELDTYNGKEVYVLTISDCNYPELALNTVFSQLESTFGDIDTSALDFSGITMQVTLKVYKDTKLPAELTIDYGDSMTTVMDTVMDAVISGMLAGYDISETDLSAAIEELGFSITVPNVIATVGFTKYNIDPIIIPKDALAAEEISIDSSSGIFDDMLVTDAPNLDDSSETGNYVLLYSEDGAVCVGLNEIPGVPFDLAYSDDFNVYYEYSDETTYISYLYYFISLDGYDPAVTLQETIPAYEDYLAEYDCENVVTSEVQTAEIGEYTVYYVVFDYFLDYPSQDILSIIVYNDSYGIALESYTMTDGEINTMATLEACVSAIIK